MGWVAHTLSELIGVIRGLPDEATVQQVHVPLTRGVVPITQRTNVATAEQSATSVERRATWREHPSPVAPTSKKHTCWMTDKEASREEILSALLAQFSQRRFDQWKEICFERAGGYECLLILVHQ